MMPEKLKQLVDGLEYQEDDIGKSEARVLIYKDFVLKIQKGQDKVASIMKELEDELPIPKVIFYEDPYLLMSKVEGKMSYELLDDMDTLFPILNQALTQLWNIDPTSLHLINQLEIKKQIAISNIKDNYYGFNSKEDLIHYIQDYQDELVLSHGDLCLPNILVSDKISYIDIDQMGLNSKWCDLTLLLRSLKQNREGYFGGPIYPPCNLDRLIEDLGLQKDEEQIKYHLLLDELL